MILSRFSDARIVIIGDVMLDRYIWGEVNRISPEAPVPVVAVKKITNVLGGAGNVASNLSSLGCQVELIGVSGDDEQSGLLNESLKLLKIDSGIMVDVNRRTITKTRIIAQKQQLLRMDEEAILSLSDDLKQKIVSLFRKSVVNADAVIVSDYGKGFFKTEGLCELIIEQCNALGKPVFVDPKGVDWSKYDHATCITPNTSEFEAVRGPRDAMDQARNSDASLISDLRGIKNRYHLNNLLMTRGGEGMCLLNSKDESYIIQTVAKEVFDVSGAGDTVIATLAAGVVSGLSYEKASMLANIAAGIVVGKIGTRPVKMKELQDACDLYPSDFFDE